MSWGIDLWDMYMPLSDHTHKGIEFLDKYGQFMKERCTIEQEYAGRLKRLAKNHQIKKRDNEEDTKLTCYNGFHLMLQELHDLAGQHEMIAENMMTHIVKDITGQLKDLKDERKRCLNEGQKHQNGLQVALNHLDKAKKSYDKAFKEAEKAHESYAKADADYNLSRAEVEKAKNFSMSKGQYCDETKSEYANQLTKTNELQRRHYSDLMPRIFTQLQDMEEKRIHLVSTYIKQSALIQRAVFPIIDKCLDGILMAADTISPQQDTTLVIEKLKSGMYPPDDVPFEDLSNPSIKDVDQVKDQVKSNLGYSTSFKGETLKGTLSVAKLRKRGGILGFFNSNKTINLDEKSNDYADLPPNQRRKKILQKIEQIQQQINQENNVREGLTKMRRAFESNSELGDPNSVDKQMAESGAKLEKLISELNKFNGYLEEVDGFDPRMKPQTPVSRPKSNRNSISEESLSRSASDSSFHNPNINTTTTSSHPQHHPVPPPAPTSSSSSPSHHHHPNPNHHQSNNYINETHHSRTNSVKSNNRSPTRPTTNGVCEHSPESGISTSHLSLHDAEFVDAEGDFDDGNMNEPEDEFDMLPVLGKARALYPFQAQSEGSIGMDENEEMEVVELDQGDGWTRVRRKGGDEEGFVPTSYIEVEIADC